MVEVAAALYSAWGASTKFAGTDVLFAAYAVACSEL